MDVKQILKMESENIIKEEEKGDSDEEGYQVGFKRISNNAQ